MADDVLSLVRSLIDEGRERAGATPDHVRDRSAPPRVAARVEPVLQRRESVRRYADRPVDVDDLLDSLTSARELDEHLWPDEVQDGNGITLAVLVWRVDGIETGLHRLGGAGLEKIGPGVPPEDADDLVLQPEYSEAAALVLALGDLDRSHARHGGAGYHRLLVRAGAVLHEVWLNAIERQLVGSIFAGFLPDGARALLGPDDLTQRQLLALALGHPTDPRTRAR